MNLTRSALPSYSMTFAFALDELVHAFALLAVEGQLARLGRDHAELVALGVLPHVDPRAADHDACPWSAPPCR